MPMIATTMIISIVVKPERRMTLPPAVESLSHLMPQHKLLCCRVLSLWTALQKTAEVQNTALGDAVSVHLVEQGPEAHAEPLGRLAAVPSCPPQGVRDGLAFGGLDGISERTAPC